MLDVLWEILLPLPRDTSRPPIVTCVTHISTRARRYYGPLDIRDGPKAVVFSGNVVAVALKALLGGLLEPLHRLLRVTK